MGTTPPSDSPILNESQRLLAEHRLRWRQESIKQRKRDDLIQNREKAEQERINRIGVPYARSVAQNELNRAKWKSQNFRLKARIIELQRKYEPQEEDSFDRIDPNALPPRHQGWRWQPRTDGLAVLPPGHRFSVRDMTQLQYRPAHNIWIQESLRMRGALRELMYKHRATNEYTAFDIGNYVYCVL